ncbi:MAG: ABC transporter permease [Acidimicrobiia bacterium]|nr:MAG: ABC transporter permease [Acidimicrobiia bacterium]
MHQMRHEWRIFWRTPISAFFTIVFPLLIFVVFALVFGNEQIEELGISTAQFYAPALAVFSAVSATYTNIAISTAYQRDEGILKRVRGTPLPSWIFLGGKIAAAIAVAVIGTVIMLAVGAVFFDVQVYADSVIPLLLTFFVGVATFGALGLLVAAIAPGRNAANAIVQATLLPLAFISGIFLVPGESTPDWLNAIASFFPLKHFAEPFTAAFSPIGDHGVHWADLSYMALWGVVALGAAIRWFTWEPPTGTTTRRRRRKTTTAAR